MMTLIGLWPATHAYLGLVGDAELYAVQAMARIHPSLTADVFLSSGSQDKYTLFSTIYAYVIRWWGLPTAAVALTLLCKIGFFAAAWALVRAVTSARVAWIALALLMVARGTYGGYGVFHFAEDCLTARSLAEALIVIALALHFHGFKSLALLMAVMTLTIHPIMALPGLLLLLCLRFPIRISMTAAALGVLMALACSLWARSVQPHAGLLAVLDAPWLEVVEERSIYVFLQSWTIRDWAINARPLVGLVIVGLVLENSNLRRLSAAAGLIGATGLAVAFIVGLIGHIAFFVQGQGWRWMWVTGLVGALLAPLTASAIAKDTRCGYLPGILLIAGWLVTPALGLVCMSSTLVLWHTRHRGDSRTAVGLRWLGAMVGIAAVAWTAGQSWREVATSGNSLAAGSPAVEGLRDTDALRIFAFMVSLSLFYWIAKTRSTLFLMVLILFLALGFAVCIPTSVKNLRRDFALTEISAFAEWRRVIPPTSSVYVAPLHYSAAFAWFTLERPSYLSVDQSAGVVFSRAAALEIRRRSLNLLPVQYPSWRLRTGDLGSTSGDTLQRGPRPLTGMTLSAICRDPELGFVVSAEDAGLEHLYHMSIGESHHWNLYDCARLRLASPAGQED